jgi:urease accessory protein
VRTRHPTLMLIRVTLTMSETVALYQLLTWSSPSYPTGAFSYSHGLEWAVETQAVTAMPALVDYVSTVIERGGGWVDAVFFTHTWRAADDPDAVDQLSELAAAFRGSCETSLESRQQGSAFLQVTCSAWPHRLLDSFAARQAGRPVAHSVVVALACAAHGIALESALHAYLHAVAANLVSAGARLIPLGQTDAQIAISRLAPLVTQVSVRAIQTSLEDLGTAAVGQELCSLLHETQYTRLFRS